MMRYDDRRELLKAGWVEIPYGQWKLAEFELRFSWKVCIAIDKDIKAIDAAPIKIGMANDGAIVRVHRDNPRWSHSGAFQILKGKQP